MDCAKCGIEEPVAGSAFCASCNANWFPRHAAPRPPSYSPKGSRTVGPVRPAKRRNAVVRFVMKALPTPQPRIQESETWNRLEAHYGDALVRGPSSGTLHSLAHLAENARQAQAKSQFAGWAKLAAAAEHASSRRFDEAETALKAAQALDSQGAPGTGGYRKRVARLQEILPGLRTIEAAPRPEPVRPVTVVRTPIRVPTEILAALGAAALHPTQGYNSGTFAIVVQALKALESADRVGAAERLAKVRKKVGVDLHGPYEKPLAWIEAQLAVAG
jgi:hypothetical protein